MSFENFLQFWSVHNRQIIEFVFVSTFVVILFVIYRQFFSKSESTAGAGAHSTPISIDTSEIEEKLKKILENQSSFKTAAPDAGSVATPVAVAGVAAAAVDTQELDKLRNEIKEKEKALDDLKKSSAASAAGATGGVSKEDAKKFEDKIKELEGRLQEYEIISEDIADLSFYKEENARLQKELSAKGGTSAAAPAAAEPAVVTPPVVEAPVAVAEPAPTPEVEAAPVAVDTSEADALAAAAAEMASQPGSETSSAPVDSVIDDDILKEFAAAVEGQKATEKEKKDAKAEAKAAAAAAAADTPAADPALPVDPQKLTESKELMGEFENFIKKG